MHRIKSYLILLAAVVLAGCNGLDRPFEGTFDQVLIYYGMGYASISFGSIIGGILSMQKLPLSSR